MRLLLGSNVIRWEALEKPVSLWGLVTAFHPISDPTCVGARISVQALTKLDPKFQSLRAYLRLRRVTYSNLSQKKSFTPIVHGYNHSFP